MTNPSRNPVMHSSTANNTPPPPLPLHFRARHRLAHARDFRRAFDARVRKHLGPITVFACPNELPHHRLGLSIGRRVGNAVTRHRLKRRLREAFRQLQHQLPGAYDFVVVARPHAPLKTDDYALTFRSCAERLHKEWSRRRRRDRDDTASETADR